MKIYYFLLALFFGAVAVIHAFPPALSFSPYKFPTPIEQHHAICKYCICDQHQKSVICAGSHILINTVHLPPWTSMFHVHNVTLPQMPHFGYSPNLKVLRINFCGLSQIHPLSFVPLPNLETIHLADNDLTEFPETLMSKMDKLRILNLARNKITNLSNIEFAIPDGLVLEQLVLDGNPIRFGFKEGTYKWPMTRQVHMANTRMVKLNGTFAVFEASPMCEDESCRSLRIPTSFWSHLITADFGANPELKIHPQAMPLLANLTALNLAETHLADSALTLFHPEANLRHLDLSKAKLDQQILQNWHYCTGRLEWLDISHIGLEDMNLGQSCSSLQWLFVSGNKLKKANIDARGLRVLHLDNNEIIEWPFPTGPGMTGKLRQLETLNLGLNKLSRLPSNALKGFITLSTLDLSHNKLMELNRESFPVIELELRFLNLSFNILTKFPEIILPNLQVLDLSANDLNSDGLNLQIFEGLPTLQHLFLSKNPYILDDCNRIYNDRGEKAECWLNSAKQLEKLSELDLSECDIKKLPSLKGFIKLQSLNLAENEIDSFDSFELPENLRKLNLQNNRIHSIGNLSTSPVATHLQDLELGNNPLHCECSLFSVAKLLKIQPDYADRSIYYCFADNWQHPLKSYFEVNERFCDNENLYGPSLLAMFFNIIGMLILCSAVAVLFGFIMLRAYRTVGCKIASYAPVPSEPPVEV